MNFQASTYALVVVIIILLVGMECERYSYYKHLCYKCNKHHDECQCPNGPNTVNSFLSSSTSKEGLDNGVYGTYSGDSISEEELYLETRDALADGVDPEVQASHNDYVQEQDQIVSSRGASGAGATVTDHYKPPNTPIGLTGFRNFFNETYTGEDARVMPSDDPDQYYSYNPTAYCFGGND